MRILLFGLAAAAAVRWGYGIRTGDGAQVLFVLWASALSLFALGLFHRWPLPKPNGFTVVLVATLAGAALTRTVGLATAPYAVSFDEAIHPVFGMDVLHDHPWHVFDGASYYFATPFLDLAIQALPGLFLPPLLGGRLASVLFSLVSLVSTYALASRLFDRNVGVFATIILTCSSWHIAYSRMAYPYMQAIMIVPLALFVLVYAFEEENPFLLYVGGILLGVSALVYTSGRIVVPVFAVWWLKESIAGRFRARLVVPVILGCALFLGPYLQAQGITGIMSRYRGAASAPLAALGVWGGEGMLSTASLEFLGKQIATGARIYFARGAWLAPEDVAAMPMLDVTTAVLAVAGLALCAARLRRPAHLLLLVWVAGTFVGGQVLTDLPHAAYRAAPLLPALAIAAGLSLATLGGVAASVLRTQPGPWLFAVGTTAVVAIVPANAAAVRTFFERLSTDVVTETGHVLAVGGAAPVYYLVHFLPTGSDVLFRFVAGDRTIHDVSSLEDLLRDGPTTERESRGRDAVLILHPELRAAESVIRRCYPGVVPFVAPSSGRNPVVGLRVPAPLLVDGGKCPTLRPDERGMMATYYREADFDGEVVRQRVEDWPMRWVDPRESDRFGSVEWRGLLRIPAAGRYGFHLLGSPGAIAASIGKEVVLRGGESIFVHLEARPYPVRLRMVWESGVISWLSWTPPFGIRESIPPELFRPDPHDRMHPPGDDAPSP